MEREHKNVVKFEGASAWYGRSPKIQDYLLFFSGADKNKRTPAGVGILIHQKFEEYIEDRGYINKHIMHLTLNTNKEKLHWY